MLKKTADLAEVATPNERGKSILPGCFKQPDDTSWHVEQKEGENNDGHHPGQTTFIFKQI